MATEATATRSNAIRPTTPTATRRETTQAARSRSGSPRGCGACCWWSWRSPASSCRRRGTQTIDTKDGFALLKTENVAYAKIIDNKQLVQLELKSNFTKTDPDTNKPHNYGKKVQFYYTFAQGAQVVQAVEKAEPLQGVDL